MFNFGMTEEAEKNLSICLRNLEMASSGSDYARIIKRYSAEHLLTLFYADTEKNEEILDDFHKQRGVNKQLMKRKKAILMEPLKRTSKKFGKGWEEMIINNVIEEKTLLRYRNLRESRNEIVHPRKEAYVGVTWEEVKSAHEIGKKVMEAMNKYLMDNLSLK